MSPSEPSLRPASRSDRLALADVILGCWHVTYAHVMPPVLVASMTPERASQLIDAMLQRVEEGRAHVIVAGDPGAHPACLGFVGFTLLDSNDEPAVGDIGSLYVAPAAQGRGVGRLLLQAAEQQLSTQGARRARLWVFADNTPSRSFYAAQGWEPDGRAVTLPEWGQPQLGLAKHLNPPTSTLKTATT